MAKKVKKDKKPKVKEPEPIPEPESEPEEEKEEVQFTDTSYTSASFESLPPVIVEEPKVKPKKKKVKKTLSTVTSGIKSDVFNWSEDSLPIEEEKKVEEEAAPTRKKKAAGKGGKKGKKKKEEEEIPNFDKPKNWKKMNKRERDKWLEERIEEWRAEKEAQKQAILAGAKEKRLALARERNELLAKDIAEQEIRRDILQKTVNLFHKFEKQKMDNANKKQMLAEWQQYLKCDGLPDPRVVMQMNTYLHLWRESMLTCDDRELEKRCIEALPMLEMLEEFVANSRLYTKLQAEGFNEVRVAMRAQLSSTIQMASYMLLRDLEKNLNMESIKLATYEREFKGLRLNLWVAVRMPTRKVKPVEPDPEPIDLSFPDLRICVKLPTIINASCLCVRAARSMIDLLSESSRTYKLVADLPNRYEDLFDFNVRELIEVQKLKAEQDAIRVAFFKAVRERVRELEKFLKANLYTKNEEEKEELDNLNMSEPPFMPDPRTYVAEQNEVAFRKYLKSCITRTRTGEINLRKYRICGGILNIDLLVTPPQPKRMSHEVFCTTFELPKELKSMKYQVQYRAPSPPAAGVTRTPEEIEAEMKKVEREYEKLALVTIDLPQEVMWTEPPVICQWQAQRKLWTTNYVNDYKYNEDKLTLLFRTGVLWPIGVATQRYSNMPYQGWDMKPDPKGRGVLLTVTGVAITVTWLIRGHYVRLKFIANGTTSALTQHFDQPYTVKRMVQIMREAACDFFPDFDAHSQIEGTCPKEWAAERHTYHAMAFLSRAYNFQWSRWNASAGWRNIIMQIREAVDKKREGKFTLLLVTPQKALVLKNNEMAQELTMEPMTGMQFYPDLFTLNLHYGSVDARRATFDMKYRLVETVFDFLQEIKLFSFS